MLALDIGGTAVKYGFFGEKSEFGEFSVKDPDGSECLPEKIRACIARYDTDCVGISAPGPFDFKSGTGLMEHKLRSLYQISLREQLERAFPNVKLFFVHDATAFILGALSRTPDLQSENVAGVMLGTGLGYVHCVNGKVEINTKKTPLHPLWNTPYRDGIAENYVSATAILNKAAARGYSFSGVREVAKAARLGDLALLDVFFETGEQLGELITAKQKEDGFVKLVVGGQVSKAWDLMKAGFEKSCSVSYILTEDPVKDPLFGICYCAEKGTDSIYLKGEAT